MRSALWAVFLAGCNTAAVDPPDKDATTEMDTGPTGESGSPLFVIVGDGGELVRSSDGDAWIPTLDNTGVYEDLIRNVAFGNGRFVAVGGGGSDGFVRTSQDGLLWTRALLDDWVGDAAYLGTTLVAVGGNGSRWRSGNNGESFTDKAPYFDGHFRNVAAGNGKVIAVGEAGSEGIYSVSSDGVSWSAVVQGGEALRAIAFGNGHFVAVGANGRVSVTSDGVSWTQRDAGQENFEVVYINGEFIVPGDAESHRSADGLVWNTGVWMPPHVAFGDGVYVGVGDDARYRSDNGSNWSTTMVAGPSRSITFGLGGP